MGGGGGARKSAVTPRGRVQEGDPLLQVGIRGPPGKNC